MKQAEISSLIHWVRLICESNFESPETDSSALNGKSKI